MKEVRNLKLPGGVEATFERDVKRIEAKAEEAEIATAEAQVRAAPAQDETLPFPGPKGEKLSGTDLDRTLRRLAPEYGDAGMLGLVVQSWNQLEDALIGFYVRAENLGYVRDPGMSPKNRPTSSLSVVVRRLREAELIDARLGGLVDELRLMRNKVVHASDVTLTRGQALSYAETSRELSELIEARTASLRPKQLD